MKKILLVNEFYTPYGNGGAERSVQHLAESLVSAGHDVVVACTAPESSVDEVNGVKVYYLKFKSIHGPFTDRHSYVYKRFWDIRDIYNLATGRTMGKILDKEKPDVVHTNNITGFSIALWHEVRKRNLRLVHTLRDYYLLCPRNSMFRQGKNCLKQCLSCKLISAFKKRSTQRVDCVIGVSRYILDRHLQYGRFKGVPNCVIHNIYERNTPLFSKDFCNYIRIGFIGRLVPEKGVNFLIQAFCNPDVQSLSSLVIAGDGPLDYVENLKSKARTAKASIEFLGFVAPEKFYARVDTVVIPSLWHEPLGRVVLEAFAHGIPVIASERGGMPEIIDEGRTGFLFDPDDPSSLVNVLKGLTQSNGSKLELAKNCLNKAKQFSSEYIIDQYLNIYFSAR